MKIHELINETETNEAFAGSALKYVGKNIGKLSNLAKGAVNKVAPTLATKGATFGTGALRVAKLGAGALTILKYLGLASIVNDYYQAVSKAED